MRVSFLLQVNTSVASGNSREVSLYVSLASLTPSMDSSVRVGPRSSCYSRVRGDILGGHDSEGHEGRVGGPSACILHIPRSQAHLGRPRRLSRYCCGFTTRHSSSTSAQNSRPVWAGSAKRPRGGRSSDPCMQLSDAGCGLWSTG